METKQKKGTAKNDSTQVNINFGRLLEVIASRWYWLIGSFVITMIIGYFYVNTIQPRFMAEGLLKYNSASKQQKLTNPLTLLKGDDGGAEYNAEIYSMRSYLVVSNALDSLGTHFYFYTDKGLRQQNVYPARPFTAEVMTYNIDSFAGGFFKILKSGQNVDLEYRLKTTWGNELKQEFKNVHVGDSIKVAGLLFILTSDVNTAIDGLQFSYIDYWAVRSNMDRLLVAEAERDLPILKATFTSNNYQFTRDFLRSVINAYLAYDQNAKRSSSAQTIAFINEQESAFESLLKQSSNKLEGYRRNYDDVVDIETSTKQYIASLSELRTKRYGLEIEARNIEAISNDVKNNKDVVTNVVGDGSNDPLLTGMVTQLNGLKYQRKQQIINFSPQAQVVKNIDEEIESLKSKIIENVSITLQRNKQSIQALDMQVREVSSRIERIPGAERDLIYLTSDVDVNKNIYNLLLNKKLETSIEKAGVQPSFTVIDYPHLAMHTFPNPTLLYLIFAVVGVAIGVGFIFLKRAVNNKFSDLSRLDDNENVPLLGVINHYDGDKTAVALLQSYSDNSLLPEPVNAIRTHIAYADNNGSNKVIVVSSEIAGEGKSFLSVNLAISLTRINKKVLVIATDLRRSTLHQYFSNSNERGLSDYLLNEQLSFDKIVYNSQVPNLYYIPSGPVPGNPSELLFQKRFWEMIEQLKAQYDYIIMDTAPVGLVSDSIPIIRKADFNIFVLRWLYSTSGAAQIPLSLIREYALHNMSIVVNDYKQDKFYGSLEHDTPSGVKYYGVYNAVSSEGRRPWRRILKRD